MIIKDKTLEQAEAMPEPKHIWINAGQVVIFTGEDIPPQPTEEP